MPIDNKIDNIIGSKLPQWLLQQLEARANKNSLDNRNNNNGASDNILYLANKSAWVRLISSVNIENSEDLQYFKTLIGFEEEIKDASSLAKQYILYGGTSKYLDKKSYEIRSGLGFNGAYGMLGEQEIKEFGYKPMPGINSVTIETQGRLGSLRAATINFKCWDKNQLDIIDTLYFKLGFTMFLEWGHTFFYPSEEKSLDANTILNPNKISSTEFFAIDPFEQNLSKEKIFSKISENVRLSEGNYDAMLGICTNFNFTYTQDGGYDCTLRIMSLGVLGDSIKINNSGNLPNLLAEEIKILNSTIAKIAEAERKRLAAIEASKAEETKKDPATITNYPDCVKNIKGSTLISITDSKAFYKFGIKATVNNPETNSLSSYYFYIDGRYQTTGLGGQGTYECKDGVLFIDGKTTEKPTLTNIDLNDYISVSVDETEKYNATDSNNFTPIVRTFPSDKSITPAPNYEGADIHARFPIISTEYKPGILIRKLAAVIPGDSKLQTGFKAKLDYTRFAKVYQNPGGNANLADPAGLVNPGRYEQSNFTNDYYVNTIEYSANDTNYKVTISIKTDDSEAKPIASSEKDERNNVVNIIPVTKDEEFLYDELQAIIGQITTALAFELFDLKFILTAFGNRLEFTFEKKLTVTFKNVEGKYPSYKIIDPSNPGKTIPGPYSEKDAKIEKADYIVPIEIVIENDTSLIEGIISPTGIIQPSTFKDYTPPTSLATTTTTTTAPPTPPNKGSSSSPIQTKQSIISQSSLELILRTIQVHSLNEAIKRSGNQLNIGRTVRKIKLIEEKTSQKSSKSFLEQIFSSGVLAPFISRLASGSIDDLNYNIAGDKERFEIQAKYGFATSLMANSKNITEFQPNNFNETLVSYVLPYNINQEVTEGTTLMHPVYIPLGLLLMILNHGCNIYDTKGDFQTPMVYIDFNNKHNFFLTSPHQLSTDIFNVIIPFQGTDADYQTLFTEDVLTSDKTKIKGISTDKTGQGESVLYTRNKDKISRYINEVKDTNSSYRGRIMNVLLSIEYLIQLIKDYSYKDGSNNVYLKPFLEQLLLKINKSLGDFNGLRLAYNDQGNCFQIVDDQFIPSSNLDDQLFSVNSDPNTKVLSTTNRTEIPLVGKKSIAKSIEIKTDISSKLSNMIAISSNSTPEKKSTLSTNGSSIGYLNTNFIDRYIKDKYEITGDNQNTKNFDTLIIAAKHFNQTILDSYANDTISVGNTPDATNYYIEKLSKIKNNNPATRAAAPIPVSINFSTDGISGMFMGNAFTISNTLLPYTYASKKIGGNSRMNNVGFIVTGLTHTIENNSWNTSVKGNMFYLKDKTVFTADTGEGSILPTGAPEAYGGSAANDKYSTFPPPDPTAYQNVTFASRTLGDPINPNVLKDISTAAVNAGVTVEVTFASTDHPSEKDPDSVSRHKFGFGVDVSRIDGSPINTTPEIKDKVDRFTAELEALGYKRNVEVGFSRAFLTYGFKDHDNHVHVSSQVR